MDKKLTHTLSPRKSVAKIQVQGKFKEAGGQGQWPFVLMKRQQNAKDKRLERKHQGCFLSLLQSLAKKLCAAIVEIYIWQLNNWQ